jgi:hypothetical protein
VIYHCCDQLRRNAVALHPMLNGIDYLEVIDRDLSEIDPLRQRTLLLRLLKPVAGLSEKNLILSGGERLRGLHIEWAVPAKPVPGVLSNPAEAGPLAVITALVNPENVLVIRTDAIGDYSTYQIQLVRAPDDLRPPKNFDPRLAGVEFSFKVECPSDFDCKADQVCPEVPRITPDINYLSKDYVSFRRLILDRLTHLVPDWRERSAADLGVTLAEILAYMGDHLSYWQDAVATEAYLETARRRTSLRRHALLVDYHLHNGCNARVWLQLQVDTESVILSAISTRFYTQIPGLTNTLIVPDSKDDREALQQSPTVFEPLKADPSSNASGYPLFKAHNEIRFYTWGDRKCCLPKGATRATLVGHLPNLMINGALLLEETKGPLTGKESDADFSHRHIVRLTSVQCFSSDDPTKPLTDPLTGLEITEIAWAKGDALPFPLCISAVMDKEHQSKFLEDISVARGNLVLCDHGMTLPQAEALGTVPVSAGEYKSMQSSTHCQSPSLVAVPPRFNPKLANAPLTFQGRVQKIIHKDGVDTSKSFFFDPDASASNVMHWLVQDAIPNIQLHSVDDKQSQAWETFNDLLNSKEADPHFVVEIEDDGTASLRFGNDQFGQRPTAGSVFTAQYRIGNGQVGNVGAETIKHIVTNASGISQVRNPLPASGGVDAETSAEVRKRAPQAFRTQERAVTPADYAEVTERLAGVQRAAATLRWTGSWHTVFITVDRDGGVPLDKNYRAGLNQHAERYRMAGHDLEFNDPIFVSLEIELLVCVKADYFRSDVRKGLLTMLSNRTLANGRKGIFHPDNWSFGQTVYLGPIYAAAHDVAGINSVQVMQFTRQGSKDRQPLEDGFIKLGRLEVARLDNDSNFPEHGVLRLQLYGGK